MLFSRGMLYRVFINRDYVVKCKLSTKQQNFRLVQIESICRRQNKFEWRIKTFLGIGRKRWFPAFSPFPTMFSKAFFQRGHLKSGLYSKFVNCLFQSGKRIGQNLNKSLMDLLKSEDKVGKKKLSSSFLR